MKGDCAVNDDLLTVAIIGNGPSAIHLSYLLSGNWPSYNGQSHPNEVLHYRLSSMAGVSIIEQDLEALSAGLEGRTTNQISLLFDTMSNPYADFGTNSSSLLSWQHHPENRIPHLVIGKGALGGAWQSMDNEVKSLSLSFLLQLPDMQIGDWLKTFRRSSNSNPKIDANRATVEEVCRYFQDFVESKGLADNFLNHHTVRRVRKVPYKSENCGRSCGSCVDRTSRDFEIAKLNEKLLNGRDYVWEISGHNNKGEEFCIKAVNLVLATGSSDCPNRLGVKGEDLDHVLHSQSEFDGFVKMAAMSCGKKACRLRRNIFNQFRIYGCPQLKFFDSPIVIVGSGLSAADAVLYAIDRQISVCHVFRSDYDDVDKFYSSLSPVTYPDYVRVYDLMRGKVVMPGLYKCLPGASVIGFNENREVIVQECDKDEKTIIQSAIVVVLIGSRPNLSFLDENISQSLYRKFRRTHNNSNRPLIDVDPLSYKSRSHEGLYAMGPLVGDNFVRFLGGGAVAIVSDLVRSGRRSRNEGLNH